MPNSIFGKLPNQVPRNSDLGQLAYVDMVQINQGFMHVREEQASGTNAGTSTGAAFNNRTLNTVVVNTIQGASLGSNIVTLLPGTYYIEARAPAVGANGTKLSVYNNTDSVDLLVGTSEGTGSSNMAWCTGQITLTTTKGIRLRQWFASGTATTGLGFPNTNGQVEVYAVLKIWRLLG